jgi:hypothetical protein
MGGYFAHASHSDEARVTKVSETDFERRAAMAAVDVEKIVFRT